MNIKLQEALNNLEITYHDLVEIADTMTSNIFKPIDELINILNTKVNSLPIDTIRDYLLQLQLKAFEISEIKEKSAMKAELATALQKEQFAVSFNGLEGSAAAKDKLATIATSAEQATEILYNLIASLFKTKLDQLHRLVAVLTSILMSRMSEAKFMNLGTTSDIPQTTGQTYNTHGAMPLNEQF